MAAGPVFMKVQEEQYQPLGAVVQGVLQQAQTERQAATLNCTSAALVVGGAEES
jgi:hypothetical protein